jgi:hypothetical protein
MAALIVATFGSSPLAMLRSSGRWYHQRRNCGEHRGEQQVTGATCGEEVHFNVLHMIIAWRATEDLAANCSEQKVRPAFTSKLQQTTLA